MWRNSFLRVTNPSLTGDTMWSLVKFGRIIWGWGSLSYLSNVKGTKALVVIGGGTLKKLGFVDRIVDYLKKGFKEVEVYEGIEPNPKVSTAVKLAEFIKEYKPDTLVALGGGSVIDATKAAFAYNFIFHH